MENNQWYFISENQRRSFEKYIQSGKNLSYKISLREKPLFVRKFIAEDIYRACVEIYDSGIIFSHAKGKRKRNYQVENVLECLVAEIIKFFHNNLIKNQEDFDEWHCSLCRIFLEKFNEIPDLINIKYGSAQKMVNVLFKYLSCYDDYTKFADKFIYCHMPIDREILKQFQYKYEVANVRYYKYFDKAWTNLDENEYKSLLIDYRKAINLVNKTYLQLEFELWATSIGYQLSAILHVQ